MNRWSHRGRVHNGAPEVSRQSPAEVRHAGRVAFQQDRTQADNPYPTGSLQFEAWEAGFLDAFKTPATNPLNPHRP